MPAAALRAYQESRETFLTQMSQTLATDARFVAAWLTGSLGRGEADALSDLDITVVVAATASEALCARTTPTPPARLALLHQFGAPLLLHENHANAPPGGTFTFTLYPPAPLMVDWVLVPLTTAQRPPESRLLFEKTPIPLAPTAQPESLDQRLHHASDTVAFFWMMAAVTAKYWVRRDAVFVTIWLEELVRMTHEVQRLVAGTAWRYQRGSRSLLAPTSAAQAQALRQCCDQMLALLPALAALGGEVPPTSPMPAIEALLALGAVE